MHGDHDRHVLRSTMAIDELCSGLTMTIREVDHISPTHEQGGAGLGADADYCFS